ncbi:putative 5'-3' exonuclease 20 [Tupanvirus soda lake]|uniref:5'-3' exonuclease 20 n=2 Tax=Tupanvirus TaxID=2094720 RepID=A0AC62AB61_9VIRU|nr:putative 5'-3' exonuclease 20 [Tupanvirus soda lake]QKU34976.1 putative 5'-3' exonuclease 20 [Tupanvirus soda lake]
MGVLEFFGTLIKNDITSTSIRSNYTDKMAINHLLLDFNSIVHVSSQKIIADVNIFMQMVLKNLYNHRAVNNVVFTEKFEKYKMQHIQKKINQNSDPIDVIRMFREHFNDKYMDKLIITLVINTLLSIVKTYCQNKTLQTLMIAIDGVPSKGKMVEQKQRRYMGVIFEAINKKIFNKYKDYLKDQTDYVYLATRWSIKWSRNKITPGTAFMHKLVNYLRSDKITNKLRINRPNMEIVLSDMYEVGEGEKKIVNYVNKYLSDTNESVMIYSPDADMILLCMLLPVKKLYMLRHNQQTSEKSGGNIYDLIDIRMLKSNITYYINNHPSYSKEEFDIDRINYDIVCISTLFGNDFVPKIETLNVKKGFQNIMDAYLKSLLKLKDKGFYLVKNKNGDNEYKLNFTFLKTILRFLLPEEDDFIKHNNLYAQYITIGQIKNVFDYMEINSENLVSTFNSFRQEYENLKNLIKNNGNFTYFETHDQFMSSLKKSVMIIMDGQSVNTSYLTNKEMIKLLRDYYRQYRDFPRLNINLNTWSHSINDYKHKNDIKDKNFNDYDKEKYKFKFMLDEYYIKCNAQPLQLTKNKINDYYDEYFGVTLFDGNGKLTKEANQVMHDYLEGMLWVFNYYFNDTSYVNTWYYQHERAPLMRHFLMFLDNISLEYFNDVYYGLINYQVEDLNKYFNPVEQLIYVSPMTEDIIKLLPSNYQQYILSDDLDPFLRTYFIDVNDIANRFWKEKISSDVDCRSIPYFNKCLIKSIGKPTVTDDKLFIKAIRKVKPNVVSIRRSQSVEPDY